MWLLHAWELFLNFIQVFCYSCNCVTNSFFYCFSFWFCTKYCFFRRMLSFPCNKNNRVLIMLFWINWDYSVIGRLISLLTNIRRILMNKLMHKLIMYYEVHKQRREGLKPAQISRKLGLDRRTIKKYLTFKSYKFWWAEKDFY